MYKLAVFDLDGTLLTSEHQVSSATYGALKDLKRNDIEVVISSGRPLPGVKKIQEQVGKELVRYLSSFNGGKIVDSCQNGRVLFQAALSDEEVREITEWMLEKDVDINTYDDQNVLALHQPKYPYMQYEADLVSLPIRVFDFRGRVLANKVMITGEPDYLDRLRCELPADWENRFNIVKSAPYFLDFNPLEANKGDSLRNLAEVLAIKQEEIMAFGDQENDLPMIEWAGMGVAMGNAVLSVKEAANYVTATNDEEGICQAVNHLVLGKMRRK